MYYYVTLLKLTRFKLWHTDCGIGKQIHYTTSEFKGMQLLFTRYYVSFHPKFCNDFTQKQCFFCLWSVILCVSADPSPHNQLNAKDQTWKQLCFHVTSLQKFEFIENTFGLKNKNSVLLRMPTKHSLIPASELVQRLS